MCLLRLEVKEIDDGTGILKPPEMASTGRGCMSAFKVTVHVLPARIWPCLGSESLSVL